MAYTFDPEKEAATVQIEVNHHRYVKINGRVFYAERMEEEVIQLDGTIQKRIVWNKDSSQMWVPPRIADQLTGQNTNERYAQVPPTAREIGRRTVEESGLKAQIVERKPVK